MAPGEELGGGVEGGGRRQGQCGVEGGGGWWPRAEEERATRGEEVGEILRIWAMPVRGRRDEDAVAQQEDAAGEEEEEEVGAGCNVLFFGRLNSIYYFCFVLRRNSITKYL